MGPVAADPNTGDAGHTSEQLAADEARLATFAGELAAAVEGALPGWVVRGVRARAEGAGMPVTDELVQDAREAGDRARIEVGALVRELLATDIDRQRTTPLALLRGAVRYPTAVLRAAGVSPVPRDRDAERLFPDDVYDLTPASFADIDPALHEPGLVWGAAKAHVHLARRRREGRR